MVLIWLSAVSLAILDGAFLTTDIRNLNSFQRPFETFAIGMFVIPILLCGGFRFWITRIRNPWLALIPYFFGVSFAWNTGNFGIYLLPEFCVVFQALSAALFLVYFPLFVKIGVRAK